jgi:hypothetical protein
MNKGSFDRLSPMRVRSTQAAPHSAAIHAPLAAAILIVAAVFGLGPNTGIGLVALAVLAAGVVLLHRPGEMPILLAVFAFQWLQASIAIFYGNWRNVGFDQFFTLPGEHEVATYLILLGLFSLSIGMRLGAGKQNYRHAAMARHVVNMHPQHLWFQLFAASWIVATLASLLIILIPGLSQLLLGVANLKWAGYCLFTYATFARPDGNKSLWLMVFGVELGLSTASYFSSFKDVFLYTLLALAAANIKVNVRAVVGGLFFGICLIFLFIIWTAIKTEYRFYLSGGLNQQIIIVDLFSALAKFFELAWEVEAPELDDATYQLIRRISYVQHFGATLNYVPSVVPYEYGTLWLDAITRPFTPRIFFPDKAIIDESLLTAKYTGLNITGMDKGTQITIGYIGEMYIDFGMWGVPILALIVGLVLGLVYRWLSRSPSTLGPIGIALSAPVFMPVMALERSSAKIVGGLFASLLASWLFAKFVAPRFTPWLLARHYTQRQP